MYQYLRNFVVQLKKNRKIGFGGRPPSARAPQKPPKNFQRPILLASQSPTRISKNLTSYYSPRDIAGLKQVIGNFIFLQKITLSQMPLFALSGVYWKQGYGIID